MRPDAKLYGGTSCFKTAAQALYSSGLHQKTTDTKNVRPNQTRRLRTLWTAALALASAQVARAAAVRHRDWRWWRHHRPGALPPAASVGRRVSTIAQRVRPGRCRAAAGEDRTRRDQEEARCRARGQEEPGRRSHRQPRHLRAPARRSDRRGRVLAARPTRRWCRSARGPLLRKGWCAVV